MQTVNLQRKRSRLSKGDKRVLEKFYQFCNHPNSSERQELGAQLGISARSVQIWFQNKRAKDKLGNSKPQEADKKQNSTPATITPTSNFIFKINGVTPVSKERVNDIQQHMLSSAPVVQPCTHYGFSANSTSSVKRKPENNKRFDPIESSNDNSNFITKTSTPTTTNDSVTPVSVDNSCGTLFQQSNTSDVLVIDEDDLKTNDKIEDWKVTEVEVKETLHDNISISFDHCNNVYDTKSSINNITSNKSLSSPSPSSQLSHSSSSPSSTSSTSALRRVLPQTDELVNAIMQRSVSAITHLLEAKASVNKSDSYSRAPLHFAISCASPDIVKVLLQAKARVNNRDCNGETALHLAIRRGNTKSAQLLFSKMVNVNARNKHFLTPLHIGIFNKRESLVAQLVELKADVNSKLRDGITPLHIAAEKLLPATVASLLSAGAMANAITTCDMFTPLHLLALGKELEQQQTFTTNLSSNGAKSSAIITSLLSAKVNINAKATSKGFTALHLSVMLNKPLVARLLLNANASISETSYDGTSVLQLAASNPSMEWLLKTSDGDEDGKNS